MGEAVRQLVCSLLYAIGWVKLRHAPKESRHLLVTMDNYEWGTIPPL